MYKSALLFKYLLVCVCLLLKIYTVCTIVSITKTKWPVAPFKARTYKVEAYFPQEFQKACLQLGLWGWVYNIAQSHHFHSDGEASNQTPND